MECLLLLMLLYIHRVSVDARGFTITKLLERNDVAPYILIINDKFLIVSQF